MGKNGNRCWEEKKTLCPSAGGRQAQCLFRHKVWRSSVGTQVKGCSEKCGTDFLLSVLQAGCSSGPPRMSSLGYSCCGPHWMPVLVEQKLPLRNCQCYLASNERSPTCGHLGWAPHVLHTEVWKVPSAAAGDTWSLQSSPGQSGLTKFWFHLSRHAWPLNTWRPCSLRVLHIEAVLQRE